MNMFWSTNKWQIHENSYKLQHLLIYLQNEEGGVCDKIRAQYDLAMKNWYIKYGDLGMRHRVEDAFMKQGHNSIE